MSWALLTRITKKKPMAENKYGRVTVERGHIPEDEPVFVLRAQDVLSTHAIEAYYKACVGSGLPESHTEAVRAAHNDFVEWQDHNPIKIPDTQLPLFGESQ